MRKAGEKELIKKILLVEKEVTPDRHKALLISMENLQYLEQAVLQHLGNGTSYETVGKMLEVPVSYVKYQERKAIRHLRAPKKYYRILLGNKEYEETFDVHHGETPVASCGFTTKTTNVLREKNGFYYIEELIDYIGRVPERFAYIEGLGKFGASEVLYYFMKERNSS